MILKTNNHNFSYRENIHFPLKLSNEISIQTENKVKYAWIDQVEKVNGQLLVTRECTVFCFDAETADLLWVYRTEKPLPGGLSLVADSDCAYVALEESKKIVALNLCTGNSEWECELNEYEYLVAINDDFIVTCYGVPPYYPTFRDKNTGDVIWLDKNLHSISTGAFYQNLLFCASSDGVIYCLDTKTQAQLWLHDKKEWLEKYFSNYISPDTTDNDKQIITIGPLIDGVIYLSPFVGSIVAMDVKSGEILWQTDALPQGVERPAYLGHACNIIYRNGILFVDRGGFKCGYSVTAIDAVTGEFLYNKDDCTRRSYGQTGGAVMIGQYYMVGHDGNYLSVFDTESREFVWNFTSTRKMHKEYLFGQRATPIEDGFVVAGQEKLYWFKSKNKS